ncbi:hypothetical protein [Marinigracilibium pacificum]|uniref:Rho-binding antiterminator n=1 Tax=Marinigracilibium pacificum TaxID=2729599 RepID=A0A848J0U7_9BACT|nr:hypothetical protein [Marinigracilibium pacificum]NMM50187.1 hypothetical protein [Marinigracilibium pacificum]
MEKPYKPISCSFYDYLEAYIIKGKPVDLKFYEDNGALTDINVKLKNLKTVSGEEFLIFEGGKEIRLDQLISIENIQLDQFGRTC